MAQEPDRLVLHDENGLTVRGHFQAGLNLVSESNLFRDLAATTAPGSGFDPDTEWLEGYIKPGISFRYQLGSGAEFYGKLSAVSSYTWGTDAFGTGDTGATTLERFDPLYYQGSPSAWATGSKSASTFISSNLNALTVALRLQPTQRDTLTLRYAHIRANELNSPVQFGQATRVDINGNVVSGVTVSHLADDVFLEYSRIINRDTFLTAGVSVSFPGKAIET